MIFVPDAKRSAEFRVSDLDEQLGEGTVGKRAGFFKIIRGGHEKGSDGMKRMGGRRDTPGNQNDSRNEPFG